MLLAYVKSWVQAFINDECQSIKQIRLRCSEWCQEDLKECMIFDSVFTIG